MARIAGVNIPDHKHVVIALTAIYGIGRKVALQICEQVKVDPSSRVKEISESNLDLIRRQVTQYTIEGDLRRDTNLNIKRLRDLGCYRGIRHRRGLPVRGQRTRTNARVRKGPRRQMKKK